MELLRYLLVAGIALASCSPPAPIGISSEAPPCLWNQGGGSASRSAFSGNANTNGKFSLIWKQRLKAPVTVEPTVATGVIFVPTTDNSVYLLSLADGRRLGSINVGEPVTSPCGVVDSLIVIGQFGKNLSVLNWVDNRKVWAMDLFDADTEPVIHDGRIYWQDGKSILHCFDIAEGKRIWEKPLEYTFAGAPAACSSGLAVASENGSLYFLSLDDGEQIWSLETNDRIRTSPIIAGNDLYYCSVDGKLEKVDLGDGSRTWEIQLNLSLTVPAATDGEAIFLGTSSGSLVRVNADDGSLGWQAKLGGPIKAGLSIFGDFVVAASLNHRLYVVDKHNGAIQFEYETEGMVSARPALCANRILLAGEDKNLYCFGVSDER